MCCKVLLRLTKFYKIVWCMVTQLHGEAAKLISGFNHTESEFKEATELLVTQCYNPIPSPCYI